MLSSLLAFCTQRDCGNSPESQCTTSFVSSLLPSSLVSLRTCIIKCSFCAIKKPLLCADSERQAWKHFLVRLGQCRSALNVLHMEFKQGILSKKYRMTSSHFLLPLICCTQAFIFFYLLLFMVPQKQRWIAGFPLRWDALLPLKSGYFQMSHRREKIC